jgi:hypothetical protein
MFTDNGNYFPGQNSHVDRSNGERLVLLESEVKLPDIKYTSINFSPPRLIK